MDVLPAEGLLASSWLLIALPLAGAAVLLLGGRRTDRWGHLLGVATVVVDGDVISAVEPGQRDPVDGDVDARGATLLPGSAVMGS